MVFSSYSFIFIFLPIALLGYYLAGTLGATCAVVWLVVASLVFYGAWSPIFVILLVASAAFNFAMGRALLAGYGKDDTQARNRRLLMAGIVGNLVPLAFFKYLGPTLWFARSVSLISRDFDFKVILPLGISFFTFTQIGYLVDCYHGKGKELDISRYGAFVTLFPHLIAGPILHIRDIGPQLLNPDTYRFRISNLSIGTSFFIIGLAKKVLLADPLADVVGIGFAHPGNFPMFASWSYALGYSLQLYFDFSGYSDMAIGLAYMFGIRFPVNFDSPYKAQSIIEFWQRWHITLTRYLTQLLYNPFVLRINRRRMRAGHGAAYRDNQTLTGFSSRVMVPTMYTMALAGIWHGAGLQYVLFGVMHGAYLTINHAWRMFGPGEVFKNQGRVIRAGIIVCKVAVTYTAVLAAEVMFRASSVGEAFRMLAGMAGLHGIDAIPVPSPVMTALRFVGPVHTFLTTSHRLITVPVVDSIPAPASLAFRLLIVWALPNSQTIMARFSPALTASRDFVPRWLSWQPTMSWAVALGVLLAICLMSLQQTKVFLYFQF